MLKFVILAALATQVQYWPYGNGPDRREWGPEERERRIPPWPYRNPYDNPCIRYGRCGPSYDRPPPMPPFPRDPRDRDY
jgi:hypothetical protein